MKRLLIFGIITCALFGCKKFDPDETIPAFIKIDNVKIKTSSEQGSNNPSGIKDVWVYVNEEMLGVFELPADIPVLKSGDCNIKVFAGIKNNGISSEGERYVFLNAFETTSTLIPEQTITLEPEFTYVSSANFWVENFEGPGIKVNTTRNSDVSLQLTTNPNEVFENSQSGYAEFDSNNLLFEIQTDEPAFNNFNLGSTIYLEMDYSFKGRIDSSSYYNPLIVGVFSRKSGELVDTQNAYLTLFPSTEGDILWNKIYVNLTEVIRPLTPTEDLDVYIGIRKASNNIVNPKLFIDNLKIIYQ